MEAEAFVPRPGEEFLSVDWVEYFEGTPREQLNQICKVLLEIRKYDVKRDSAFAVVNCLKIRNVGNSNGHDLSVMTLGEQEDPSHSGVYGLPGNPESDIIHQEIANCASVESAYD
ncbi:MAG: hypothetical protein HY788_21315 [Deltaproteobacteria bacterium]|nr:hypothetical protein [Deltaproteobacteria bacterium]